MILKESIIKFKQKIIAKWLPLSIDIQGLSKIEESKRGEYIGKICKSNNNKNYYKQMLVSFWNLMVEQEFKLNKTFDIESVVQNHDTNECLLKILKSTQIKFSDFFSDKENGSGCYIGLTNNFEILDNESKLYRLITELDSNNHESSKENTSFFLSWLQQLSEKFDEMIAKFDKNIAEFDKLSQDS